MTRDTPGAIPSHPKAREDVVFRSLAKEWVLYDPETRQLHVLNATAALIWTSCDGTRNHEELAAALSENLTDVPPADQLAREVREALEVLHGEGLLK